MASALGQALEAHRAGRLDEAEAGYAAARAERPDDPDVLHLLGFLLHQRGRGEEGLALIARAAQLAPAIALFAANSAEVLLALGRVDEAEAAFRRALALDPAFGPARPGLAKILLDRGEHQAALEIAAPALDSGDARLLTNLGVALFHLGRKLEAAEVLSRAEAADPALAAASVNLGNALRDLGDWPGALARYRRALELDSGQFVAYSNLVFARLHDPGATGEDILAEAGLWERLHPAPPVVAPKARDPEKRLRIGYVSPDFRDHAVAYFVEPLLAAHDRSQVEVICYSGAARPDRTTERLRTLADGWRETAGLGDAALADLIRADGIDILADLAGHTAGNRLLALAARPAPVQVSFILGSGTTTGLSWIDAILADAVIAPPGFETQFSERLIRLPGAFAAFRPRDDWPEVSPLPEGAPLLGCFTDPARIDGGQVELWRRALAHIPGGRILFKHSAYDRPDMAAHWRGLFGFGPDQALFEGAPGGWTAPAMAEAYGRVSLMLDTWPVSGGSSSLIMLWMGLPVASLVGRHSNQRVTASILHAAGLPELAAESAEAYVELLAGLAQDRPRLAELRRSLRQRLRASPLLDQAANARAVEDAYRGLWRVACEVRP